jgi:hypothetical protein
MFCVRYSVLPFLANESSLLSSWIHAEFRAPEFYLLTLYQCLHLFVISVRHPLKTVLRELDREDLIEVIDRGADD